LTPRISSSFDYYFSLTYLQKANAYQPSQRSPANPVWQRAGESCWCGYYGCLLLRHFNVNGGEWWVPSTEFKRSKQRAETGFVV
jgi:hypothetical protein